MHVEDVSVVMANYNYAQFLTRAVKGVLSQSVRPREFIVIDDCSTDNSLQILNEFARQDPLLRIIRNEKNRGILDFHNRAVDIASGKYIALIASDDYILPGMIEKSLAILRKYPFAGLSSAYHSVIKEPSGEILPNPSHWCAEPRYFSPDQLVRIIGPGCIPVHTAVFRREALLEVGGFDGDLRWHCDWFTSLVIGFRHGLCHVPETIALISERESTYSSPGLRIPIYQQTVLRNLLRRLISPAFADVLPSFQSSGVMTSFGPNLVHAAAEMPERWTPGVLGLIDGLELEVYETLLVDANEEVRELSRFLLGPMWWRRKKEIQTVQPERKRSRLFRVLDSIRRRCRIS